MDQTKYASTLEKVAKLMALGNDAAANENEAATALRQAAKLMAQYAIKAADVERATGKKTDFDLVETRLSVFEGRTTATMPGWVGILAVCVAQFAGTLVNGVRDVNGVMWLRVRGEAGDVAYTEYLVRYLEAAINRADAAFNASRRDKTTFRQSMATRLGERMQEIKRQSETDLRTAHGTAMTVLDTKRAAVAARFGSQRVVKRWRDGSAQALAAGAASGNAVNFNQPISGQARRALAAGPPRG